MKVEVEMQNGDKRTYENADRVEEQKYSWTIYGKDRKVLASLNKGDVKNLFTEEAPD